MKKRQLQIDVIGPEAGLKDMIRCKIYIDGCAYLFWTTLGNYETLKQEKFFLRTGQSKDSAGVINTTNVFSEEE